MILTSHGTNYALNEYLDFTQYDPCAIPSEVIPWYSYPVNLRISSWKPYWVIMLTNLLGTDKVLNELKKCWLIWSTCDTISDNAMLQLCCKCGESKWSSHWFVMLMSSSDSNNVLNEQEDFDHVSIAKSPKIMSCYQYGPCKIIWDNAMFQLSCTFSESKCNPHWLIYKYMGFFFQSTGKRQPWTNPYH